MFPNPQPFGRKHGDRLNVQKLYEWDPNVFPGWTMGNSRGPQGSMRTPANYDGVLFTSSLKKRSARTRLGEWRTVLRLANVRMPDKETRDGREGKIGFWREHAAVCATCVPRIAA